MKRILLNGLFAVGFLLFASGNAFAQRHGGFPAGPLNAGSGGHENAVGPAHAEQAPAVRNEVRANQPNERMNEPAIANGRGEHPFYGNERGRENDWRYRFNDGRWWYWTPLGAWAYWNDGRWADYSAVPYTTGYRGPAAPVGWYWNDNLKRYFWFDGTNLTAAQQ